MRSSIRWYMAPVLAVLVASQCIAVAEDFDVIVRHGRVVDGSGNPWFRADVGIRGTQIVAIGDLSKSSAVHVIDAKDHIVAPGFIEMMGGDSHTLVYDPVSAESKLRQGCTTMLVGEGDSETPQNDRTAKLAEAQLNGQKVTWRTLAEYNHLLTEHGIGMNVIHDVGMAQIRQVVIGDVDRVPTAAELEKMKALVAEAMQQGSVGVSTALIYPPGNYAKTAEIVAMAKVAASYGGTYFTHMRNESGQLLAAIDEAISIGEQAEIPVHIYHLKAAGKANWPLIQEALKKIQAARDRGLDVTADAYPYIYNGLALGALIPPEASANGRDALLKALADPARRKELEAEIKTRTDWENWYLHAGSDWNNVLIAKVPAGMDERYEGLSVHQVAQLRGKDDWTTFFDLVQQGDPAVSPRSMDEDQKRAIYKEPWVSISSDASPSNPALDAHVHPRTYGTFPRIYAKYVREEHVLTLEDAVRKMTSLPADQLGLYDRGRIGIGMKADLVVFDAERIQDTATFAKPATYPTGIDAVLVNGTLAIEGGKSTQQKAGVVLLHAAATEAAVSK